MSDNRVCSVCGKPLGWSREKPFCSRRCADVDLGRWLTGSYRLAGDDAEESDEDAGRGQEQE